MVNIYTTLKTLLQSQSLITDLVSTRIYGEALPNDVSFPAIVIVNDGFQESDCYALTTAKVRFTAYANDELEAVNVGQAIHAFLTDEDLGNTVTYCQTDNAGELNVMDDNPETKVSVSLYNITFIDDE